MIENTIKRLRKEISERYENLCEEEKDRRRKKAQERCQNFTEEKKEKEASVLLET